MILWVVLNVDGSEPCPPQFIPVTDETGKVTDQLNPKYTLWQKRDQFSLVGSTLPCQQMFYPLSMA